MEIISLDQIEFQKESFIRIQSNIYIRNISFRQTLEIRKARIPSERKGN